MKDTIVTKYYNWVDETVAKIKSNNNTKALSHFLAIPTFLSIIYMGTMLFMGLGLICQVMMLVEYGNLGIISGILTLILFNFVGCTAFLVLPEIVDFDLSLKSSVIQLLIILCVVLYNLSAPLF